MVPMCKVENLDIHTNTSDKYIHYYNNNYYYNYKDRSGNHHYMVNIRSKVDLTSPFS